MAAIRLNVLKPVCFSRGDKAQVPKQVMWVNR